MVVSVKLLKKVIWDTIGNIGIHPQSVTKDGKETPRGEYGDGWNAAVTKLMEEISKQIKFIEAETDEDLLMLLEADVGWAEDDLLILNMNDTFAWGCADAEEVNRKDYKEVARLYKAHGIDGLTYWVAEKRGYDPDKTASPGHKQIWENVQLIRKKEKEEKVPSD